ncbi:PREDICTED: uncharacterized protein LOC109588370 [Amphimedon queenslandica]|uniref:Uncharacterized protein n=1 Tax=Amphimedon queenslandica TaxID=400682 RepID=A0A1X7TE29_AMPQE|nr:PREDICTED: uncharacterized protein LOC109588370 [Amphimedon queenslandica]|eukprot:XP_019860109.1 PREDICTED: uncharacterized protein LOC109588370 [Amphimedon queenslandica]
MSLHHTGKFALKFMIQQHQWRKEHEDSHYAAALFRYMREYVLLVRDHCSLICVDGKHKVKVGEPGFPVASAERGRRVAVRADENFVVGDHDFTKFGLILSVTFIIKIPDEICGSWYDGKVYVGLKDSVFEPSSPIHHMTELYQTILKTETHKKPILFIYSDGGPDHRLTYILVQLSLICLFIKLDLDYLCACRTAPYHSWRNPVERIMSILNLGLQCVGLAREQMTEEFEKEAAKANLLSELRAIASQTSGFEAAVASSLSPVKSLLHSIFNRLKLHDDYIHTFDSASTNDISDFWTSLLAIDCTLKEENHYIKANFSEYKDALTFVQHCCEANHYSFDILKCGSSICHICKPVRLLEDTFKKLRHIPHPTPSDNEGHYLPFSEVFGITTSEEHRPSFKKTADVQKKSVRHKNTHRKAVLFSKVCPNLRILWQTSTFYF